MIAFARLYAALDGTNSTSAKVEAMAGYFAVAPPADAAWAVYFLTGRRLTRLIPHRAIGRWAMARRLAIMAFGLCLTVFSLNIFWLGATLFVAGIGIAPALAVLFAMTSASVKFSETAEAYGWIGTGQLIVDLREGRL